jgi:DNA-binding Lrp family transcriptional regulator
MASKSWRDVLEIHSAAELFPMMSVDELQALGKDIKERGLLEGVALLDGKLLDGRIRFDAMEMVGINFVTGNGMIDWAIFPCRNVQGVDPVTYVISKNIHRWHLTAEQRLELIAKLVTAAPNKSDRQIAEQTKASPTTVGRVRQKLEASGRVSTVDTRIDKGGRKQWAHKPPARKPAHTKPQYVAATSATVDQPADVIPPELPHKSAAIEELTEANQPEDLISVWTIEVCSCVANAMRQIEPGLWLELIAKLHEELDRIVKEPVVPPGSFANKKRGDANV